MTLNPFLYLSLSPRPPFAGNLDASQQASLREMWRRFFELSEKNKHVSEELDRKGGPKFASKDKSAAPPANEKDAGKNIPKGDAAKEEAKKMEEMKEMNSFLEKYGGPYLLRACWEFNKVSFRNSFLEESDPFNRCGEIGDRI